MKTITEPLENRQMLLTIEVDEERTQKAMRRVVRQIAQKTNFPGFRKGKAPYGLIVQRYGEDTIRKEAAEVLTEEVYREALEQEGIKPYALGVLDELALYPITFKLTIPLHPITDLGDYRDYRLPPPEVKVHKKQVQQALEKMREQNVILERVARPAALGDRVAIDLLGRTAEGVEFLKGDGINMLLDAESADPVPGFAEAIVGMNEGEERILTLTLPDDFHRKELQGQAAEFTIKLAEVYESTLPELDDDLARTVGNFDSLKELEEHVRKQLQQAAQEKADEEYAGQVLKAIIEQAHVEYPPGMLKEALDEGVEEIKQAVKREAHLSMEDYLRVQNKSMEELREDLEPHATARLKRILVMGDIVRLEGLNVDEEEISAQIEEVSSPWGARADEMRVSLNSKGGRQAMRSRLLSNKAVQRLVAIAKGEAPEIVSTEEQGSRGDEETRGEGDEETRGHGEGEMRSVEAEIKGTEEQELGEVGEQG